MIINQANLQGIYRGFKTIFNKTFAETPALYETIATLVPSTAKSEEYKWLGKVPRMREWVGDRVISNLAAYDWTIKNKDWEATVEVDRNDIEDDSLGIYNGLVQAVGVAGKKHPDELIFPLLLAGFTSLCYDSQYFFDTDHLEGKSGVQSNKGTGVLNPTNYNAAYVGMMVLKGDDGKPLGVRATQLVVPPQLWSAGFAIVKAEKLANGLANPNYNSAELLIVPELGSQPTQWFLQDTSKPVKPLIFQQRKLPQFISMDKPTDDNVFMSKKFIYGIDSRDNVGYGLWQLSYGSLGTV